jgi:hypothetical protein
VNIATIPTGYLKDVVLHNGDFNDDVLRTRIYSQRRASPFILRGRITQR